MGWWFKHIQNVDPIWNKHLQTVHYPHVSVCGHLRWTPIVFTLRGGVFHARFSLEVAKSFRFGSTATQGELETQMVILEQRWLGNPMHGWRFRARKIIQKWWIFQGKWRFQAREIIQKCQKWWIFQAMMKLEATWGLDHARIDHERMLIDWQCFLEGFTQQVLYPVESQTSESKVLGPEEKVDRWGCSPCVAMASWSRTLGNQCNCCGSKSRFHTFPSFPRTLEATHWWGWSVDLGVGFGGSYHDSIGSNAWGVRESSILVGWFSHEFENFPARCEATEHMSWFSLYLHNITLESPWYPVRIPVYPINYLKPSEIPLAHAKTMTNTYDIAVPNGVSPGHSAGPCGTLRGIAMRSGVLGTGDTLRLHQTWLAGKWTMEIGDFPS